MAEYIEREALIKHIERSFGEISTPFVVKEIKDFPNADVVEVVRCKDCRYYDVYRLECHNPHHNGNINCEGFCSYGERRCDVSDYR